MLIENVGTMRMRGKACAAERRSYGRTALCRAILSVPRQTEEMREFLSESMTALLKELPPGERSYQMLAVESLLEDNGFPWVSRTKRVRMRLLRICS